MTEPDDDETNEKEADITKDSGGRVGGSQEGKHNVNNYYDDFEGGKKAF